MTIEDTMLAIPCRYCGAEPGAWCTTRSGARAGFLHSYRWWAWKRQTDPPPADVDIPR